MPTFQQSPGVYVTELDLTTIVPGTGTTVGAFAGNFAWGPVEEVMVIDTELTLASRVGNPDSNTFVDFFTAANFLAYATNLNLVRAANTLCVNATSNNVGVLIKNTELYYENFSGGANTYGQWMARYPGSLGNSIKVSTFAASNANAFATWTYSSSFAGTTGTSKAATAVNAVSDEIHVIVIDSLGKFTGVANTVLEKYAFLSKAPDLMQDDGTSMYYRDIINQKSKYIYWGSHPTLGTNWGIPSAGTTYVDLNGTDYPLSAGVYSPPTDGERITSFNKFQNVDSIDISLLLTGNSSPTVTTSLISNIAEVRKDCVVFISPKRTDVVNQSGSEAANAVITRNLLTSSSYAFMDSGWKYQFDKYNNVYRYVPLNGDMAGLAVQTDTTNDPWFSIAGFNRGHVKNVIKLAWNPTKTDRDILYNNGINPVVTFPGEGPVLYGDKTLLAKPSAFDRINVRRLFIVLEKSIAKASKYSLFEFNDEFTRARFVNMVEPFLRDVQGRRGITAFKVVCDGSNNTGDVIDRNEFRADIYIQPARSINYITLSFIATPTGVAFTSIIGTGTF